MQETEFLKIITETLSDNRFIGDDCAYLLKENLFITQDTLVEDVHFSLNTTTPFQLGLKAVAVNISDLAAAFCRPLYISVGMSVPKDTSKDFVKELYRGIDFSCKKYNVAVTGGDITGAEKCFISVTAIGKKVFNIDTSRSFAKNGELIFTTGNYGASASGLIALTNRLKVCEKITAAHLVPTARLEEVQSASNFLSGKFAAMDTSDGLADALYKISKASKVSIEVNFDDVPVLPEVKQFAEENNLDLFDLVLWGGEDFEIIISAPQQLCESLINCGFVPIGKVLSEEKPCVKIQKGNKKIIIDKKMFDMKSYNHFGG